MPFEKFGLKTSKISYGHRFFSNKRIKLLSANLAAYKQQLLKQYVIVDPAKRRKKIVEGVLRQQKKYWPDIRESNLDSELVDEVTNLVEYPRIITGNFEKSYLKLPAQVLTMVMKVHQRYFPIRDAQGHLLPKFIIVANGPFKKTKSIKENNERVLRARLADAAFFWEEDLLRSLEDRVDDLAGMIFHNLLGSYRDKVHRIQRLTIFIARKLEFSEKRIEQLERAAYLCKSDLTTLMVTEFTNLQGIIGMEYARCQGDDEEIAMAIFEHYLPRSAEDDLPKTEIGQVLALADKLDTVVAFISVGIMPTGSGDPYGLRRQAQGVIRILAEQELPLRFDLLVKRAVSELQLESNREDEVTQNILKFFKSRLEGFLEVRDISPDIIKAVLATEWNDIQDAYHRSKILQNLKNSNILLPAATIIERTSNIVRSWKQLSNEQVRMELFQEQAEHNLYNALKKSIYLIEGSIKYKNYIKATEEYIKAFSRPLSAFFDEVMVNVEDEDVRKNRLVLLNQINKLYTERVADLSLLQFQRGEHIAPIVTFVRLESPEKIKRGKPFKIIGIFSLNVPILQNHKMFIQIYQQKSRPRFVDIDVDLAPQINEWGLNQEIEVKAGPLEISHNAAPGTYIIRAGLHYFKGREDKEDFKQPYTNIDIQNWEVGTIEVE